MSRFYKLIALVFFMTLQPSAAAWACDEPVFPMTDEIKTIQAKDDDGGDLTPSETFLLDSYKKDRDHYLDIYQELYPCALYADQLSQGLPPEDADVLKQELLLLERKWSQQGTTARNVDNTQEEFIDLAPGEVLNVE